MLWQLLLVILFLWTLLEQWRRRHLLALAAKLPSVAWTPLPLIGHTHKCLGNDQDRMKLLMGIGRDAINAGGLANLWFGRKMLLVCSDAACAEVVLKYCLDKNEQMDLIRDFTGNGIIFADVNVWRPRRKVMAPVFNPKTLAQFIQVFQRQSQILVDQLGKASGSDTICVWKYLTTYTMDAVCETNLGVSVSAQLNPHNEFLENFDKVSQLIAARVCQPWLQLELIYPWTRHFVKMVHYKEKIYSFIEDIIRTKRKETKDKENEEKTEEYLPAPIEPIKPHHQSFKSFLELLIEKSGGNNGYTDVELREECLVIAVAGTDTSAVGACFTLCLLARYPEVQEKIYQEILEVLGKDELITPEVLPKLKYLEATVKESLRLYPPVPVITRKVEKHVQLPSGHTLVPGVGILINIYGIHRNPRYWGADADLFRPERFLEPLSHPAAFVAFSHGPRNCIGYQYAMMSMKTAVASIVRKYKILPPVHLGSNGTKLDQTPEGLDNLFKLKFDIMMKDTDNFQLRLEKRQLIE